MQRPPRGHSLIGVNKSDNHINIVRIHQFNDDLIEESFDGPIIHSTFLLCFIYRIWQFTEPQPILTGVTRIKYIIRSGCAA